MYTALHRCYNRGNTVIAGASRCVNLSWPPSLILAPLLVHHKFGRPVEDVLALCLVSLYL
jgi:hypothetical protein